MNFGELNLDQILDELTQDGSVQTIESLHENFYPMVPSTAQYEDSIPLEIRNMMNHAMEDEGSSWNFQNLLLEEQDDVKEDDENAMDEVEAQLGPDADIKMFQDLPNFRLNAKKKKRKKVQSAYPALPDELAQLMQKANFCYIQGQEDEAIKLLQKVIQERPYVHEAWLTLGMIYNARNDVNRTVQCRMMAAHLSPKNSDLWLSIGYTSKELGHLSQAEYCFKKARSANLNDTVALWELAFIYLDQNKMLLAEDCLENILKLSRLDRACIKELARVYLELQKPNEAIKLFENLMDADAQVLNIKEDSDNEGEDPVEPSSLRIGFQELNMLAELYLEVKDFESLLKNLKTCLYRIFAFRTKEISYDSDAEFEGNEIKLPIDIRVKLGLCRLYMGESELANDQFKHLYELDPDDCGDLFYDIAHVYMELCQYLKAIDVLERLTTSKESENVQLWQDLAKCYHELGSYRKSIEMHQNVLQIAPLSKSSQDAIIQLLEELGEDARAEEMLMEFYQRNSSLSTAAINSNVVLDAQGLDQKPLLSLPTSKPKYKRPDQKEREVKLAQAEERAAETKRLFSELHNSTPAEKTRIYKKLLVRLKQIEGRRSEFTNYEGVASEDWLNLGIDYAQDIAVHGKEEESLSVLQLLSNVFHMDKSTVRILLILQIAVCVHFEDFERLGSKARLLFHENENEPHHAALFPLLFKGVEQYSQNYGDNSCPFTDANSFRFVKRLVQRVEEKNGAVDPAYQALLGHLNIASRISSTSLPFYESLLTKVPNDPLLKLCLGAMAYFKEYRKLRGDIPETWYNIGRAYHHIGIHHLALKYYEKAANHPDKEYTRLAAYNMSLIYVGSGSSLNAQNVLRKYCTVD